MSATQEASKSTDDWNVCENTKIKASTSFDFLYAWHTRAVYGAFICRNNRGEEGRKRQAVREEQRRDRDREMYEDTADWVTKLFACSLTAGSPSLSSLQLRLLLREEQIMTTGRSTRFRLQTLQEGWRTIQQAWMHAARLHLEFKSLRGVHHAYRCHKNAFCCSFY